MLTSTVLAALILTLPLSVIAAPSPQAAIDIKTLALTKADLPPGFEIVPDRTVAEDRPGGVAVYDVTFARERTPENLSSGPFEVRSGVARTASVEDAILQLESTREAFLNEGWEATGVPPLGDETLGLTQTTDGEGGQIAHFSYLFRKDAYIVMVGIRGRPEAIRLNDVVGLAIVVSGRLDKALAGGAPASAGAPAATGASSTGERVRVVNADGGSVNVRAEPSTSATVVTQVSEGTALDVVGPDSDAEARTWRNVRTSDGQTGWIASTLLETIPAPPAPPAPSPSPVASPSAAPSAGLAPAAGTVPVDEEPEDEATEGAEDGGAEEEGAATPPTPVPTPTPAASSASTFQGSGNGLTVEGTIREPNLSSGRQNVKVRVLRNGQGVGNAFVDVTARFDERRYRAFKLDRTTDDGYTEIEWDMEGPAGNYEVIVEVRTSENGPVTTAKGSFKWQ